MKDSLGFSFAGRTMDYFGGKAITSDITAVFELVKNSRDANAKQVTIHFKDIRTKNACIELYDDGDGMSEDDVKKKWMVIGTDSRLRDDKTKSGKPVLGEMGIGRMACQKLGGLTELISVKNKQRIKMAFDWSLFEKPGITVDKIMFPVETSGSGGMENGVTLEIKNLKSEWDSKKINELKEELSVLITNEISDDIKIRIRVGKEDGEVIGKNYVKLMERVTDNAPFKLKAKFDGKKLTVSIFTQVGQRGKWEEQESSGVYDETVVGPFSVEVFHFPRAPAKAKSELIEQYYDNRIGTEKLEAFLKNNYGMYLYRDGAWMKPYGGKMDWLSLEAGARQETSKIGLKQVFGRVLLSKKKNPEIKPASHRETLIENKAFLNLQEVMKEVFEILRNHMKDWKKEQKKTVLKEMGAKTLKPEKTVEDILQKMSAMSNSLPKEQKKQFRLFIRGIDNLSSMQKQETEAQLVEMGEMRSYEKNLATLGIATSFMARQVTGPLEKNMDIVAEGEQMRERIMREDWKLSKKDQDRTEQMLESMKENQAKMLHFMQFVNVLADHIAQSIRRNKRRTQVSILECWQTVSDGFQDRKKELDIIVTHSWSNRHNAKAKENLVIKIDRIDLECILTNLYLNSIESLRKTKNAKRRVTLHYWHHDDSLYMEFSDNGRGIPKSKLEEVFEPFKFGHNQDDKEMHGHGLGLHIVKKIMEHYDGTVNAVEVKEGAKIRMVFPKIKKVAS